ncbi:DDE-type integrase/transposase/recombinase [Janthinobacterium sp. PAMC25594]|nr:DDE-type integrase/transposase/recombinase [Janthinobacterium sp. PAMC25594]
MSKPAKMAPLLVRPVPNRAGSTRTVARWCRTGEVQADARPTAARPAPAHKLSEQERQRVLDVCHEARFADLPPAQIVPRLADEGTYLASESTFYRILRAAQEQQHRGRTKAPQATEPQRHVAHGPNEVWSWDVTYLPSQVRGMFFYLYAVIDLFSRKLVAWEVHAREGDDEAAALMQRACWRECHPHGKPLGINALHWPPTSRSTSAIHRIHGSVVQMKLPTACCVSVSPRGWIFPRIRKSNSTR